MKEIKFRGFREKTGEWVYGYLVMREDPFLHDIVVPVGDSSSCTWAIKRGSEGQYTGLKDKNGTEIYDGDYIRYSMRTINGSIYTHVCRVFQHESGTWRIEGYHEDNHSYETKGTVYAAHLICEVIGNIYEHNHLLG